MKAIEKMVAQTLNVDLAIDQDLVRRVRIFLASQSRQALRGVEVNSEGGVVTLRGRVHSYYEKQLSVSLASRVAGVHQLKDQLRVQTLRHAS